LTALAQLVAVVVEAKLTGVLTVPVAGTVTEHSILHSPCAAARRSGSANETHKLKIKMDVTKLLIGFAE
jgi:hypothetical protein